jgi:PAS domain S-box-containing protein
MSNASVAMNMELSTISSLAILIVDDSSTDFFTYTRYLREDRERFYQIVEAETLDDGLALWRSQNFHLIIIDINLPDGSGLELLEEINTTNQLSRPPVIMMTGQGSEQLAVQAMKLGASDYLVKEDITPSSLRRTITNVLNHSCLTKKLLRLQQQETIIAQISLSVRQFLSLEKIYQAVVTKIRTFLAADRIIIYKFFPDMSGEIVAEAVIPPWQSCLHIQVIDTCFQENKGVNHYQAGHLSAINDIYEANLTDCHRQLLEDFQVRANLVAPILIPASQQYEQYEQQSDQPDKKSHILWGLLIAHQCSGPRLWEDSDHVLLERLSVQVGIALQQVELYESLQNLNKSLKQKVSERTAKLRNLVLQYQEAETKLKFQARILDEIHDSVICTDIDGNIQHWNCGAEKLYGYQAEEIIGQNITILYDDPTEIKAMVIEPLLAKGEHEIEVMNRTKFGQIVHIHLRLSLIKDTHGNVIGLLGCSNNITARKTAEIALQKQEPFSSAI